MLPNNDLVKDPRRLQFFLLADVIFVILLISIIIRQIVLILVRRRKSYDESRLYIKFVNLFAAMALGPAIGLVIITSLFFNLELRTWYGDAVRDAVVNSNIVARNYENEIQAEIVSDTQLIMREILKVSQNNEVNIQSIRTALSEFINLRTISSIYIFNTEGNIYLSLKKITDPYTLDMKIKKVVGVVETGLFINMANSVIIGNDDGSFKLIEKKG